MVSKHLLIKVGKNNSIICKERSDSKNISSKDHFGVQKWCLDHNVNFSTLQSMQLLTLLIRGVPLIAESAR